MPSASPTAAACIRLSAVRKRKRPSTAEKKTNRPKQKRISPTAVTASRIPVCPLSAPAFVPEASHRQAGEHRHGEKAQQGVHQRHVREKVLLQIDREQY